MDENRPDTPESQHTRVCRKCSTQTVGTAAYCPNCGTRFDRRRRGRRTILLATLVLLLAGGATAGVLVKRHHDDVAHEQQLAQQRAAARAAAREAAAARRARHRAAVRARRSLVRSLQRSVTKDAQEDVDTGVLTGPILRTECTPVGGGNIDDTAQHTGAFECLAVHEVSDDGTMTGYRFEATVNYDARRYTWHLGD